MDVLCLYRHVRSHASAEGSAISERDMHLGTVCAIFEDGQLAHDFAGEFVTCDHCLPGFYRKTRNRLGLPVVFETSRILDVDA
jgi:hypothetical protein